MSQLGTDIRGILGKLLKDRAGNTFAIVAASTIPLMALIGGGVDISRAYMTKTELQAACDAGVLAGRRAMAVSGEYGDNERATADRMFDFNFTGKAVDASNIEFTTDDNDDGQVVGTASTIMPTAIMKIFGKETVDLSVNCMAELQIGNADIMFVLDTTGSMGDPINDGEPTKIEGLRDAVRDFHQTINQAINDKRTRVRYGFVPYSMTVNAKNLLTSGAMPSDYFSNLSYYQSRVAVFETKVYVADEPEEIERADETNPDKITKSSCEDYGDNNGNNPIKSGTSPDPVITTEYNYVSWTTTGKGKGKKDVGTCVRRYIKTKTVYETKWQFTKWRYQEVPFDTSSFKQFSSTEVATNVTSALVDKSGDYDPILLAKMSHGTASNGVNAENVGTTLYTWNGCLEERQTVDEADFDPIPDDAYDLNLDLKPESDETRWHPMGNGLEFSRSNYVSQDYYYNSEDSRYYNSTNFTSSNRVSLPSAVSTACPSEMRLFRTVELSSDPNNVPDWLNTFVNNLVANGNTYHDLGMIWGGRLTSPTGVFAGNVNLDADKISVSKHIIFMTDGEMMPTASGYSAYGIENLDSRIAPKGSAGTITSRHNARFSAVCEAIKAQGTTIWVVAFGTSMTTELQNCATKGRAYYSSNPDALRERFRFIAAQVADLRLGQ